MSKTNHTLVYMNAQTKVIKSEKIIFQKKIVNTK